MGPWGCHGKWFGVRVAELILGGIRPKNFKIPGNQNRGQVAQTGNQIEPEVARQPIWAQKEALVIG